MNRSEDIVKDQTQHRVTPKCEADEMPGNEWTQAVDNVFDEKQCDMFTRRLADVAVRLR